MTEIQRIDTDSRRDVERFVRFPFRLYGDCPQWVPPILSSARNRLYRKRHSFYRNADADFFLALQGGEVVGRIAVIEPRRRNAYRGQRGAFFCMFDVVEDADVARALFAAACDWARARGLEQLSGPEAFAPFDGLGVLVKGFEHHPALQQNYNYPYYDRLIQEAGLHKQTDYISCYFPGYFELPERVSQLVDKIKERRGLHTLTLRSRAEVRAVAARVIAAYNAAFANNREFVPIDETDAERISRILLDMTEPELVTIVAKGDEIVGFTLGFPDVSAALQRCKGHLLPFGWAMIRREARRTDWVNFNGGGVLPQYQGLGVTGILYDEMFKTFRRRGFEHAEVVQINEQNDKMIREIEGMGGDPYKAHRIYEQPL